MIVTNIENDHSKDFENVLGKARLLLLSKDPNTFQNITADDFELEVFNALRLSSENTIFEGTFGYLGGKMFPDIITKTFGFGVEVKKVITNSWSTLGNSIMESTRAKNIDKIYTFYGKLGSPIDFKFGLYENCLSDVIISHSPRYQVNMEINSEQTIFNKIGIPYEDLRQLNNPFQPIKEYFRDQINEGEEPWWLDQSESRPHTKIWKYISPVEKKIYRSQMMGLFPQVFGNRQNKYNKPASWLLARHQIINPSFRDCFSAGGKTDLIIKGKPYQEIPQIFGHLQEDAQLIKNELNKTHPGDLLYYLSLPNPNANAWEHWINLVVEEGTSFLSRRRHGFEDFPLRDLILEAFESG
jgi:hypothetical protein